MSDPLQEFGWKKSNYDHPEKDWNCGRLCEGKPCQFGPDSRGRCQVKSVCTPIVVGDRYECTREPIHGGKCKEGPGPDGSCCQSDLSCTPVRTLRSLRKQTAFILFAICLVFCLYLFGGSSPSILISPGELTSAHGNLNRKCSECHTAAEGGLSHWMKTAVDFSSLESDSQKCLKCHQELGDSALTAHGMTSDELQQVRLDEESLPGSGPVPFLLQLSNKLSANSDDQQLACSTCHREHHGQKADIKKLTDTQCQKCHQQQFESFTHGHPELQNYSYEKRTNIYFDHAKHFFQHFKNDSSHQSSPEGIPWESCNFCHVQESSGRDFQTKGFEVSCASCHETQIIDPDFAGFPLFALPPIKSEEFVVANEEQKENLIGEWPNRSHFSTAEELPAFMKLVLKSPNSNLTLQEIVSPMDNQKDSVVELAWEIKNLFRDKTLQEITSRENHREFSKGLLSGMVPSAIPTLSQAGRLWFPHLESEWKLHEQEKGIPVESIPSAKKPENDVLSGKSETGWLVSTEDFTIRYRPVQHEDPLLRYLLDELVTQWDPDSKSEESPQKEIQKLFQTLANPVSSGNDNLKGPISSGSCLKCHTVTKSETGHFRIQWKPNTNSGKMNSLTKFSHKPHVVSREKENCQTCHSLNPEIAFDSLIFRKEFLQKEAAAGTWKPVTDPAQPLSSGFRQITRLNCTTCHNRTEVSQSCLQCHQYHFHRKKAEEK